MITELRAQNFKSWKDTGELQFAPLTGFFGANSSGKTSILQVLLMLKQTTERPADWNEPLHFGDTESLANLGSFDNIIHKFKEDLTLGISVSWKVPKILNIDFRETNSLFFSTSVVKKHERAELEYFSFAFDENIFKIGWTDQGYMVIPGNRYASAMSADPFRCYGIANASGPREAFSPLKRAFENIFSKIHYLGPLREHPRHDYIWDEHPADVGQRGEEAVPAVLLRRVQLRSIDNKILDWLVKLEIINSYRLEPNLEQKGHYKLYVTKHKGGPEVRLTDVGFGVSQVLPVLIACYFAREGSILILEQPEAHLHPKVQSELADVLIDVVKNRNIQIILESHSEHLLHRLMRRIAEDGITEEAIPVGNTAFYFCQIGDGNSTAEKLKVDEYGNISNWPQNFFGDEMGDLAAKARAEIQRKKEINQ